MSTDSNHGTASGTNRPDEKLVAFASIRAVSDEHKDTQYVTIAPTIEDLKEKIAKSPSEVARRVGEDEEFSQDITDLGRSVWQFYKQLRAYYEVADAVQQIPNAFTSSFFKVMLLQHAENNFIKVEEHEGAPLYGLRDIDATFLERRLKRWDDVKAGFEKIAPSILLSVVASFDSAFSDFTKGLLKARPERFYGSEKKYSVAEIVESGTVQDVVAKVINDEVDSLMSKSHSEQIKYFEEAFGIGIKKTYLRWPNYIELFERRNLVAHGDLCVNRRYIHNCEQAGLRLDVAVGSRLEVDTKYLRDGLDILVEFGVLLAFSAWQKQAPHEIESSFYTLVEISFDLLTEKRPVVAQRILEHGLLVSKGRATDEATKMMIVNRSIALKTIDQNSDWLDVINGTDWTASNLRFQICAAAVREDEETVLKLLGPARLAGVLESLQIRDWPAFKWMRKNENFSAAFEREFGEPLLLSSSINLSSAEVVATEPLLTPPPPADPPAAA